MLVRRGHERHDETKALPVGMVLADDDGTSLRAGHGLVDADGADHVHATQHREHEHPGQEQEDGERDDDRDDRSHVSSTAMSWRELSASASAGQYEPLPFHPSTAAKTKKGFPPREKPFLVGPEGIEPSTRPPQGRVLPLYYGPLRPFVRLMMLYLSAFVNGVELKGPRGVVQVSALSSRTVPPQCREPDGRDVRPRDSAALCGVHPRTSLRVRRSVAGIR